MSELLPKFCRDPDEPPSLWSESIAVGIDLGVLASDTTGAAAVASGRLSLGPIHDGSLAPDAQVRLWLTHERNLSSDVFEGSGAADDLAAALAWLCEVSPYDGPVDGKNYQQLQHHLPTLVVKNNVQWNCVVRWAIAARVAKPVGEGYVVVPDIVDLAASVLQPGTTAGRDVVQLISETVPFIAESSLGGQLQPDPTTVPTLGYALSRALKSLERRGVLTILALQDQAIVDGDEYHLAGDQGRLTGVEVVA